MKAAPKNRFYHCAPGVDRVHCDPYLNRYFIRCVIGGPVAIVVPVHGGAGVADAVRRTLVPDIAGHLPAPQSRILKAPAPAPDACRVEGTNPETEPQPSRDSPRSVHARP